MPVTFVFEGHPNVGHGQVCVQDGAATIHLDREADEGLRDARCNEQESQQGLGTGVDPGAEARQRPVQGTGAAASAVVSHRLPKLLDAAEWSAACASCLTDP
ncbi:MAG: hypothetical protein JWO10_882 [Microbacteriaceae bacterium]|nr:hypothetical protein [Microbacteriaceae bacterium]